MLGDVEEPFVVDLVVVLLLIVASIHRAYLLQLCNQQKMKAKNKDTV